MFRDVWHIEEVREIIDHVRRFEFPVDSDRQAYPCELVDYIQHSVFYSVMRLVFGEVKRPNVVRITIRRLVINFYALAT